MTLRITAFNHFAAVLSVLIYIILAFIGYAYFQWDKNYLFIFSILTPINILPALYLHRQYFLQNKSFVYEISKEGITEYHKNEEKFYKKADIKDIVIWMSPSVYQKSSLHLFAVESYHYAKIVMKEGDEIIVTCLLTPSVEEAIKILEFPYRRKKSLFCRIK